MQMIQHCYMNVYIEAISHEIEVKLLTESLSVFGLRFTCSYQSQEKEE